MESVFNFPQPSFLEDQIESIVYKNYGFKCRAKNIYSDRDQNFYIEAPDHKQFILKISNPIEEKSVIKMQNESVKFKFNSEKINGSEPKIAILSHDSAVNRKALCKLNFLS